MSSPPNFKNAKLEQLQVRRQLNLEILAASNRHPGISDQSPVDQRKTILTVEQSNCRWPIGDPQTPEFYLCGASTGGQHRYCAHHMKMAYTSVSGPKRVA